MKLISMLLKLNILEVVYDALKCMTVSACSTVKCWEHKHTQWSHTFNKQDFLHNPIFIFLIFFYYFRTVVLPTSSCQMTSSEEKVSPTETVTFKCTPLLNAIILTWLEVSMGSKSDSRKKQPWKAPRSKATVQTRTFKGSGPPNVGKSGTVEWQSKADAASFMRCASWQK